MGWISILSHMAYVTHSFQVPFDPTVDLAGFWIFGGWFTRQLPATPSNVLGTFRTLY